MNSVLADMDKILLKNLGDEQTQRSSTSSQIQSSQNIDVNPNLVSKRLQEVVRIKKTLEEEISHEKELSG